MAMYWDDVQRLKRVEAKANELGFIFSVGNYSYGSIKGTTSGFICLKPRVDCLPLYSRDAEIYTGTVEEIEVWLRGFEWAREYDSMLKLSNNKLRERKEQDERNKQLLKTVKTGKKVEGVMGSTDINTWRDTVEEFLGEDDIPF